MVITFQEYVIAGAIATSVAMCFILRPKSAAKSALVPVVKIAPSLVQAPTPAFSPVPVQTVATLAPAPHEVAHGAVSAAAAAVQVAASITTTHPEHVQKAAVALTAAATKVLGNVESATDAAASKLPAKKDEVARQSAMNDANEALKKATDALQRARV